MKLFALLLLQSLELGLVNSGPLATETTHRVRALSMPGSLTVGGSFRKGGIVAGVSLTFTTLTVTECKPSPCQETGRDYRPHRVEPIEQQHDAVILTPRIGYRWKFAEAGISAPLLQTAYSLVGPSPMLVAAPFVSAALGWGDLSGFIRYTVIPPQSARWTALSEVTRYKTNGQPFPNGSHDPLWIRFLEAGIRVGR